MFKRVQHWIQLFIFCIFFQQCTMVKSCWATKCKERSDTAGKHFFSFPLRKGREELLEEWLEACRRKGVAPTKNSVLCERHFTEADYFPRRDGNKKRLRPGAVPSIFPTHLVQRKKTKVSQEMHMVVTVKILHWATKGFRSSVTFKLFEQYSCVLLYRLKSQISREEAFYGSLSACLLRSFMLNSILNNIASFSSA